MWTLLCANLNLLEAGPVKFLQRFVTMDKILSNISPQRPNNSLDYASTKLTIHAGIFFAILGRGPRAFQIGKISVANP